MPTKTKSKRVATGSVKKRTTKKRVTTEKSTPRVKSTVTKEVFKKKPGSRIRATDVEALGQYIVTNKNANDGEIDIAAIIADKDDKDSPVYRYFTRNIKDAAQKQWETEAKYIIRSIEHETIKVNVLSDGTEEVQSMARVRAFVSVPNEDEQVSYRLITDVLADKEHTKHLHLSLYKYLLAGYEKFCAHGELIGYLDDIRPVLISLGKAVDFSQDEVQAKIQTILERVGAE
jgi:hypothetical protein